MLVSGRLVFAAAMAGFGIVSVVFVDFVRQLQPVSLFVHASTPGYAPLAILTGVILVAAGIAIGANQRTFQAAAVLAAFFASWVVFLQIPSAFAFPALLRSPWWIRTFETVVLAGAALILAGQARRPERDGWIRTGRLLVGVSLPVFGVLHLIYPESVAALVPAFYPWPMFLAYFTGAAKIAAGIAIAANVLARLAATLIAVQYALYALTLHIPRQFIEQPAGHQPNGITSMFIAIAFCGVGLIVAGSEEP